MNNFQRSNLVVVCGYLLVSLRSSTALHTINGEPPKFLSMPREVAVCSTVFYAVANEVQANLVILCNVSGNPTPTVTWFREDEEEGNQIDATLVIGLTLAMNVTEDVEASRSGVSYYCIATNKIGPSNSITATVRSQNVLARYKYFNGFRNEDEVTVTLATVLLGAVAMECDVLDAIPKPQIQWFFDNEAKPIAEIRDHYQILYLDGGRYLYIRTLTAVQRMRTYHCEVANVFQSPTNVRAPTTYTISGNIVSYGVVEYRPVEQQNAVLGELFTYVYAVAVAGRDGITAAIAILSCNSRLLPRNTTVSISNDFVLLITGLLGDENRMATVKCGLVGTRMNPPPVLELNFLVTQPVIINTPRNSISLTDRKRLAGGGPVLYVCDYQGIPPPTVRWYYNGAAIPPASGVSVNGNTVMISDPQISHSGIYQCLARNTHAGENREDSRAWILEVRLPTRPSVVPLFTTNAMAIADRLDGTLIVASSGTNNISITALVNSDPCPSVEWSFGGSVLANGSSYTLSANPCGEGRPPFTFRLTIATLGPENSGQYSAVFNNSLSRSTPLPSIVVTVPTPIIEVLPVSLTVETVLGEEEPNCLLDGRDVILTCNIVGGYPRPVLTFRKGSEVVVPGEGQFYRATSINYDQILISGVQRNDEATYSCETTVDNVTESTTPTPLQYCTFPRIIRSFLDPTGAGLGQSLAIECHIDGVPPPSVSWTKDNVTLSGNDRVTISLSNTGVARLLISKTVFSDNGLYACNARSDAGLVLRAFRIDLRATKSYMLTGGPLIGVIVMVLVTGMVAMVVGAGIFMPWLWSDYFALKPQSKDHKASWMEPNLGDFSDDDWGKVKKMRQSNVREFYHSARGSHHL